MLAFVESAIASRHYACLNGSPSLGAFSRSQVQILDRLEMKYEAHNVLEDDLLRQVSNSVEWQAPIALALLVI